MKPVIALTKGRLEKQFLNFFEGLGYEVEHCWTKEESCKLKLKIFSFSLRKDLM